MNNPLYRPRALYASAFVLSLRNRPALVNWFLQDVVSDAPVSLAKTPAGAFQLLRTDSYYPDAFFAESIPFSPLFFAYNNTAVRYDGAAAAASSVRAGLVAVGSVRAAMNRLVGAWRGGLAGAIGGILDRYAAEIGIPDTPIFGTPAAVVVMCALATLAYPNHAPDDDDVRIAIRRLGIAPTTLTTPFDLERPMPSPYRTLARFARQAVVRRVGSEQPEKRPIKRHKM